MYNYYIIHLTFIKEKVYNGLQRKIGVYKDSYLEKLKVP